MLFLSFFDLIFPKFFSKNYTAFSSDFGPIAFPAKKNVKYKQNILAKKMKLNLQPLSDSFFIGNGIIAIPLKKHATNLL